MEGPIFDMVNLLGGTFIDPDTPGFDKVMDNPADVKLIHATAPTVPDLTNALKKTALLQESDLTSLSKSGVTIYSNDTAEYRKCVLYSTKSDLVDTLDKISYPVTPIPSKPPKLCFIVTCQGTHYPNMGRQAYRESSIFLYHFDFCAALVKSEYAIDIKSFLLEDIAENVVPDWMNSPVTVLPYLLALQFALFKLWESWGIKPDYVLGLSFGEYGAAVMAGMTTIEESFHMVMTRVRLMTENMEEKAFCVGMMDEKRFEELVAEAKMEEGMEDIWFKIVARNSPKQTCVLSDAKYSEKLIETCKKHSIKTITYPYHPYHSSLTLPIIPEFSKTTSAIDYQPAKCKYISTVNGKMWDKLDKQYFLDHLTGTAEFIVAIETAVGEEIKHFMEIGPHPIHIQMAKDILSNNDPLAGGKYNFYTSLKKKVGDRIALLNSLGRLYSAGYEVDWQEVEKFQSQNLSI